MIVFTETLALIIAAVVALVGVATSTGSVHSLGDHFVLSGHHLSRLSAGRLFLYGIVVRIARLLGFSVLLGASTWRLASRGSQRALTGSRQETTAPRLDRDRLADEPIQRSRAGIARPGRGLARCCGSEANIMIMSGPPAQTAFGRNSDRCGTTVRRCPASGVTASHHVGEPYPGRHHPRQRQHQRACRRRNRVTGSVNAGRRNRNAPRRTRPGGQRVTPSKKERR